MICFLCATPYHIILSMFIKQAHFLTESADILIYNHFDNSQFVCQKLNAESMFSKVMYVNENNRSTGNKLKRLIGVFHPNTSIHEIAHDSYYQEIIFFSLDFLNISYIIKTYYKRNLICRFCYGEDGIGTYMDPYTYVPRKVTKKLLLLMGRKQWLDKIQGLYVLEPYLLQCHYYQKIFKIEHLFPNIILDYCRRELWSQSREIELKQVIYLQEPFQIANGKTFSMIEKEVIDLVKKIYTTSNFSLKLHPRSEKNIYENNSIINNTVPFECLISEMDICNSILISILSTAAITPILLYNKTPYIIFIYKLFSEFEFDDKMTNFIKSLNEKSDYSKKIFIPESVEELKKILLFLKDKNQ